MYNSQLSRREFLRAVGIVAAGTGSVLLQSQTTEPYQLARRLLNNVLEEKYRGKFSGAEKYSSFCSGCAVYTDKKTGEEIPFEYIFDKMRKLFAVDPSIEGKNPEDVIPDIVPYTIQKRSIEIWLGDYSFSLESKVYFDGNGLGAKLNLNHLKNELRASWFDGQWVHFTDRGIDGIVDDAVIPLSMNRQQAYLETLRKIDQLYSTNPAKPQQPDFRKITVQSNFFKHLSYFFFS